MHQWTIIKHIFTSAQIIHTVPSLSERAAASTLGPKFYHVFIIRVRFDIQ